MNAPAPADDSTGATEGSWDDNARHLIEQSDAVLSAPHHLADHTTMDPE